MKIRHKFLSSTLIVLSLIISGCGNYGNIQTGMKEAMNNNKEIVISVAQAPSDLEKRELTWIELDQLTSFKQLRKAWDDRLSNIRFDISSKNGVLFIADDGSWNGNSTLYNAFKNKQFVELYKDSTVQTTLAHGAIQEFSDVQNEGKGLPAAVNAYFNLLPTNKDGSSGMDNYLTRAEVMSAICRADTPVEVVEVPEEFVATVGENVFNEYAIKVADNSYLDYRNGGLNSTNYNGTMTRLEAIYILVNRYFNDELNNTDTNYQFNDCTNGGNLKDKFGFTNGHAWQAYMLEYSIQKDVLDEQLYKALVVAARHGIIGGDTRWKDGVRGGELINFILKTYLSIASKGYVVNAKLGSNVGESLYVKVDTPVIVKKEETEINIVTGRKLSDLAKIRDLIAAYPDEIDMTEEEIAEAELIGDEFTIEEYEAYMKVDHCGALNVRKGPSTDYKIIKSVKKGTKVHIVGICAENGWYRVIADGKICYQCGVYFSEIE